jgi:phage-related minor tail protein
MATLERVTDAVNFKVKEGLLSTAQGVDAISKAKASAADQLATLIPQIEQVSETAGPKAAAQVEKFRAAFRDLAKDVKAVSSDLSKNLSSGFESAFGDFMRNAKSGSEAFEAFGQSIIDQMAKIASQRVTANFITPLIDSVIGSILPSAKGTSSPMVRFKPMPRAVRPMRRFRPIPTKCWTSPPCSPWPGARRG